MLYNIFSKIIPYSWKLKIADFVENEMGEIKDDKIQFYSSIIRIDPKKFKYVPRKYKYFLENCLRDSCIAKLESNPDFYGDVYDIYEEYIGLYDEFLFIKNGYFDQAEKKGWINRLINDHTQWSFLPNHIRINYDFCGNNELKSSYDRYKNYRKSTIKQEEIIKNRHTSDLGDLDCFKEIYENNPPIFLDKEKA